MNILDRKKLQATTAGISAEEIGRRQESVNYARASVRLEGFELSSFAEDLNRRFVNGEITRDQMGAALLAHYAPK